MIGEWTYLFLLTQLCGALALIVQNGANFLPCGKKILRVQMISASLWAAYYALLGIHNIAIFCVIGVIRNWQSAKAERAQLVYINIFFTSISVAFLIFAATTLAELVPVIITTVFFFRMISRDNLARFHGLAVIGALLWTAYHFYNGAFFGVMNDSIAAFCALLALTRLTFLQPKQSRVPVKVPA